MKTKKILVVGASIAGPAVCYWLKQFGFSPTLIEKSDTLRKGGYAIDIRGVAVALVKQMGIYEKVVQRRTQVEHGYYVDAQGNTVLKEQGEKFSFRQNEEVEIPRGDLVSILMDTLQDVPCYFGEVVEQLTQDEKNVTVTFKDGRTEQYDLLIGADGLHSSIRRMVFTQDECQFVPLHAYLSVCSIPNYLQLDHTEMLFELNQKLVHMSSDSDPHTAHAGFMFRSQHQLQDIRDEKEQKDFLKETFFNMGWESNTILQYMETSEDFYFDAIMQVKMHTWSKGRVVLLGDAGYCASPLSGQGTSLALVGAYVLAGELKKAEGEYATAFKRYDTLLHPFVLANQDFGVWASETFFLPDAASKKAVEKRADDILKKLKAASHAIRLPQY